MCSSLYKPNEKLLKLYHNLDVAYLKAIRTIETMSLDSFATEYSITAVDFLKLDIQGAELEVFKGGAEVLAEVVALVCEVEFVPLYEEQPLFGDVCAYLSSTELMFHKFLGLAGRALSPVVLNNDKNSHSQLMWSDALFIKNVLALPALPPPKLLKLGVLAHTYDSPDLAYHCFSHYDRQFGSDICREFVELLGIRSASKHGAPRDTAALRAV
jgi:hypothetical protein